jgi:hypothetical protein
MSASIATEDWQRVHELACDIANASGANDEALTAAKVSSLFDVLRELEAKYGRLSRIIATYADYTEKKEEQRSLLKEAFEAARREGDLENAGLIWESLTDLDLKS